jgi:signal peptidase I
MKYMKKLVESLKKFYEFLQKDTFTSLIIYLIVVFLFLLLIFFPVLRLITGTYFPLVIVESCSMYHDEYGFDKTMTSSVYSNNDITINDTLNWDFPRGLNKGDIIFIVKDTDLEIGDVIIFNGGANHPIIHRIIDNIVPYQTKGDNYVTNSQQLNVEKNIREEQVLGRAVFKIPYLGWIKLIFFDWKNPTEDRGFCKI